MANHSQTSPPPLWPKSLPWLILGYAVLGLGTLLLAPTARGLGLNLLNTLAYAHVGLLMWARSRHEVAAARGWRAFALGLFAQALAQGWASLYMLRHGAPPLFPAWGDLFSFLSIGLIVTALLAWPLASASGSERLRKGMDGFGAGLSAFFLSWFFALGPLFHASGSSPRERAALVTTFVGNATILGICAYLGARRASRLRGPLGWISMGYGIALLNVILLVPLSLTGGYYMGHPLDLLVLLLAVFLLLATHAPLALEPGSRPDAEIRDLSRAALILPMLPAAMALAFLVAALIWTPRRLDAPLLGLAIALVGLGILRGLLALRDLQRLSLALETRVFERTQSLEAMQQAMLRTERMNAVAVLGAGMAHDLNNTLATVKACAELALMKLDDGRMPERKDLDHILVATDQSVALTNRLMRFGRREEEPVTTVCLSEEFSHLETILRMLLGRQIALRLELGEAGLPIQGSRGRLEQIFVNLVSNARDAMPKGGTITLRLTKETVAGKPVARMEVEDTGEGMSPDIQARLFSPFFTTKGPSRGTGLGLASVRQLMKDLGGTLTVASEPGVGTTFVLRIPLAGD